jgi:hypothetical protein
MGGRHSQRRPLERNQQRLAPPDRSKQICALQALSERIARYFPSAM